ncbi:glycine betaine ABC transporter substrate-binding protein [Desulfocurvus sp. DL9XJH121]
MHKKILTALLAALMVAAFCVPAFAGKGKVRLAYVEWSCATASTNLAQAVLQEKLGYEVEILPVAAAAMWQAVGTGDVDGMVTAWLPVTHADYFAKFKDKVENLGPITGGAKLGWAVPAYVKAESIADLNKYADKFDGRIIGIDPGSGLMRLSEKAVKAYGLKLELMEGSGATMTAALANAEKNNEWVVVTAWSPHWMFGKWDLKYLKDPKGTLGGEEHIDTIVRKDLQKDLPEVYNFLDKFHYESVKQFQTLMAWNQEKNADPYENAKRFIKENPQLVDSWLK